MTVEIAPELHVSFESEAHSESELDILLQVERDLSPLFQENEKQLTHPGEKFNAIRQAARHIYNLSVMSKEEADEIFVNEFTADATGCYYEVIKEEPLLRNYVKLLDGDIVCTEYGNLSLEEVSKRVNERDGAVVRALKDLKEKLNTSKPGDLFLFTSPPGWHGMKDLQGQDMKPHEESQTWLYYHDKNKGLISGTIRTDMDPDTNVEFLKLVQKDILLGPFEDERDKLVGITETVVSSRAESFEQAGALVISKMESAMNSQYAFANPRTGVKYTFGDLKRKFKGLEKQTKLKKDIQEIIDQVCEDVSELDINEAEDFRKLVFVIGQGILDMNAKADGITGKTIEERNAKSNQSMEDKRGCPPSSIEKMGQERTNSRGEKEYYYPYCPFCERRITHNGGWISVGFECGCGKIFRISC